MKPIATHLALLVTGMGTTIATFHLGLNGQGYTTMTCAVLTLLAFQGKTQFHRPQWAEGIELTYPPTGHILATTIIVEAAALAAGIMIGNGPGIAVRIAGLVIQAAAIGKLSRDYLGGETTDRIHADIQDATVSKIK